ncbi:MAG: hypothetical protein NTY88_04610 [Bacteroidetes bacterium]|nr:hypothetical protein [Bacteroidota bacterium]
MKNYVIIFFVFISFVAQASDAYRTYLLSKVSFQLHSHFQTSANDLASAKTNCVIPHYEIPKGNVFCRMEDYLTRKTNVWIKVGVK